MVLAGSMRFPQPGSPIAILTDERRAVRELSSLACPSFALCGHPVKPRFEFRIGPRTSGKKTESKQSNSHLADAPTLFCRPFLQLLVESFRDIFDMECRHNSTPEGKISQGLDEYPLDDYASQLIPGQPWWQELH